MENAADDWEQPLSRAAPLCLAGGAVSAADRRSSFLVIGEFRSTPIRCRSSAVRTDASRSLRGARRRGGAGRDAGSSSGSTARPEIDGLLRAGLAHVWFESIHPFEDGNGRVGRAIVDLALAQDARRATRLLEFRAAMRREDAYYDALNAAQRGTAMSRRG